MSRLGKVKVFDSKIDAEFAPGGDAWQFTSKVTREITYQAIRETPGRGRNRSGRLAASHYTNQLKSGRYGARGYVGNSAPYAETVHEGHLEPIFPHGEAMQVPRRRYGLPKRRGAARTSLANRKMVKGQRAQPWISHAARVVLSKYGAR